MTPRKKQLVKQKVVLSVQRLGIRKLWYAIVVRTNCELKVERELCSLGYEAFVPTRANVHHWTDRDRLINNKYFPLIVFVRLKKNQLTDIRKTPCVVRFVTNHDSLQPISVPFDLIINLQRAHNFNLEPELPNEQNMPATMARVYKGKFRAFAGEAIYADIDKTQFRLGLPSIGYVYFSMDNAVVKLNNSDDTPCIEGSLREQNIS